jgi:hypothetical protein
VLDVAALDYFGSAGLRVLLVAAKRLRETGAIALASPKDFIRSVIDVAGLGSIVTIHCGPRLRDRTSCEKLGPRRAQAEIVSARATF